MSYILTRFNCILVFILHHSSLWLPSSQWHLGIYCIQFYYHLYGKTIGTLKVLRRTPNDITPQILWQRSNNHGNKWIEVNLNTLLYEDVEVKIYDQFLHKEQYLILYDILKGNPSKTKLFPLSEGSRNIGAFNLLRYVFIQNMEIKVQNFTVVVIMKSLQVNISESQTISRHGNI